MRSLVAVLALLAFGCAPEVDITVVQTVITGTDAGLPWPPCPETQLPGGSPVGTLCTCATFGDDGGPPVLNCVFPYPVQLP